MNQPALYHRADCAQRYSVEQILKKYSKLLQWRSDGMDTLIDIGTGSGDVLKDFIYPLMPRKFDRLMGSDISTKMCNYAHEIFKSEPRCEFTVLDIATEEELPIDLKGQFDHITSFYCLSWVQNQRQVLKNVYNLLRPESGDCLLAFPACSTVFHVHLLLSKSLKWSSYMADVERFISPFNHTVNPHKKFATMLRKAGFTDVKVELLQETYDYKTAEVFKDNMEAINPFVERIPPHQYSEFLQDFYNTHLDLNLRHNIQPISITTDLIVAYARKIPRTSKNVK
uniref:Methyltransf_25 domain-containing protein n=1 Tax=Glossina brevipalpis TaxID=37001 RepID=A0A1A9WKH5_9MUSC